MKFINNLGIQCILLILYTNVLFAQGGVWTWMKGEDNGNAPAGNYGILGVPALTNEPPHKYEAGYWTDLNGNFWIFGGNGVGSVLYNDLWKYDISTNMWTWMKGPQYATNLNGNYGTMGVPSVNNLPSARGYGFPTWTDMNGDLWMYGGYFNGVAMSDLWRYQITTNEWTWMGGSNTITAAIYGNKGVPSVTNTPGSRMECKSAWADQHGNLFLYGGIANTSQEIYGDLWKYNIGTNLWTWLSGANTFNSAGSYGIKGVASILNEPPARLSYTHWMDQNNNIYLFAGGKFDPSIFPIDHLYNDVWKYDITNDLWTWVGGTNDSLDHGNYGAYCNANQNNLPWGRIENQTTQTHCNNICWSFGGFKEINGLETMNDLWIYDLSKNEWTLMSGNNISNLTGNYGTKGVASTSNMIGARGGSTIWADASNNIWVFGGAHYGIGLSAFYNDLWKFTPDNACIPVSATSFSLLPPNDTMNCANESSYWNIPSGVQLSFSPNNGFTYNLDSSQIIFDNLNSITYNVIAFASGSCNGIDTIEFTMNVVENPIASFSVNPTLAYEGNGHFQCVNTSSNSESYEWFIQQNLVSTSANPFFNINEVGIHCILLVSKNSLGCVDSVEHCVQVIKPNESFVTLANVFTPNGDGNNDIIHLISKNIKLYKFAIYNRWGEEVFTTSDISRGWDGSFKGSNCELGTYYYFVKYSNSKGEEKLLKGDIILMR